MMVVYYFDLNRRTEKPRKHERNLLITDKTLILKMLGKNY